MSLCTVALIYHVTSKINIKSIFKNTLLCFQPRSTCKAPELLQPPHRLSHVFVTPEPGQVPGWVMIICCVAVAQ